jgi:anti-sigma regulatory factor (Ser/Thr protein kinase)
MVVGLPEQPARDALRRALLRAGHAAAFVVLGTAFVVALASAVGMDRVDAWFAVVALLVMAAGLTLVVVRPTVATTILYLAIGTGTVLIATVIVMSGDTPFASSNNAVLAMPRVALVLVGGAGAATATWVAWTVAGFVLGEVAALIGTALVGAAWAPNTAAAFATAVVVAVLVVDRAGRRSHGATGGGGAIGGGGTSGWMGGAAGELKLAERRAHELDLLAHRELRATARLHDTALMHLLAIASAGSGPVDDRLRAAIRKDLALIAGPDWANSRPDASGRPDESGRPERSGRPEGSGRSERSGRPDGAGRPEGSGRSEESRRETSGRFEGVGRAETSTRRRLDQSLTAAEHAGLEVRLTGDPSSLEAVTPERAAALDAAVAQCLVNVARHAGVDVAEVAIGVSDGELTIAVMDAGVGFDEAAVPRDRIGLRTSIRGRIEHVGGTVTLRSTRNVGTTVVLSVPTGGSA